MSGCEYIVLAVMAAGVAAIWAVCWILERQDHRKAVADAEAQDAATHVGASVPAFVAGESEDEGNGAWVVVVMLIVAVFSVVALAVKSLAVFLLGGV